MVANERYQTVCLETSARCNLRCVMCGTTLLKEKDKGFMSDSVFESILPYLEGVQWVHIGGAGEPFLDKKIFSRIKKIKECGCSVSVVTHGGLLNDEKTYEILECGLDVLRISFHGATKKTYEEIKIGSQFEKVLQNVKNLIYKKKESRSALKVCFNYTVMKKNVNEIPQFVDMALEVGIDELVFIGLFPFVFLSNTHERCENEELTTALQYAKLKFNRGVFTLNIEKELASKQCSLVPEEMLFITYDGNVYPCCSLSYPNLWAVEAQDAIVKGKPVGNVLVNTLHKIWKKEEYMIFRNLWKQGTVPEECKNCDYVNIPQI